ncbi:MAG: dTDP-4-dehydrorhamnose 3,5-epimerase [Friedmanniella sp.]|nr:dTDP-4-dehydrorhamnose 3,5-epimerase [Friedmanniella sp.]
MTTTPLAGLVVFRPQVHYDDRGFFTRTFDAAGAAEAGVDPAWFVQDSQSRSRRGVVRAFHGRGGAGEGKLVRCARGAVWDTVVDIRPDSPTFSEAYSIRLDDETFDHLFVPPGFLHGYQVVSELADVCYRITREHDPSEDLAVHYADPDLAVAWPEPVTAVSARDQAAGSWVHLRSGLGR